MKTKEELNALKEEVETVSRKLRELTEDELEQGIGGCDNGLGDTGGSVSEIVELLLDTVKDLKERAGKLP